MFNNKKIRFATILAIILCTNITMAKDNASESTTHQIINWSDPIEIMERQLDYFDNYWGKVFNNRYYKGYHGINNKFIVQDKQYIMILEIPGFDKEQVKIKLNGNRLVINGYSKEENKKEAAENYKYTGQNNFNFSFVLNEDVDKGNIKSSLKNGVLTITLPRVDIKDQKTKEIPIN